MCTFKTSKKVDCNLLNFTCIIVSTISAVQILTVRGRTAVSKIQIGSKFLQCASAHGFTNPPFNSQIKPPLRILQTKKRKKKKKKKKKEQ